MEQCVGKWEERRRSAKCHHAFRGVEGQVSCRIVTVSFRIITARRGCQGEQNRNGELQNHNGSSRVSGELQNRNGELQNRDSLGRVLAASYVLFLLSL
eukprot:817707-Prorocentrum_minimum.AAC.2